MVQTNSHIWYNAEHSALSSSKFANVLSVDCTVGCMQKTLNSFFSHYRIQYASLFQVGMFNIHCFLYMSRLVFDHQFL